MECPRFVPRRNCRRVAGSSSAPRTAKTIGRTMSHKATFAPPSQSPIITPTVRVAGFPSEVFVTTAMRCAPFGASFGIVKSPVTVPSVFTFAVPMRIGLEKSHASTVDPGSKPESLIRILSPVFNRTLPSASRAAIAPVSSMAARLA